MRSWLATAAGLLLALLAGAGVAMAQMPPAATLEEARRLADAGQHLRATASLLRILAEAPPDRWSAAFRGATRLCVAMADGDCGIAVLEVAEPVLTRAPAAVDPATRAHAMLLHSFLLVMVDASSERFVGPAIADPGANPMTDPVLFAELHLLAAERSRQRAEFVQSRAHLDRAIVITLSLTGGATDAARLLVRCAAQLIESDEAERAARLMAAAAPLLAMVPPRSVLAWEALQVEGSLAGLRHRLDLVTERLERALAVLAGLELQPLARRRLERTATAELLGAVLASGDLARARSLLASESWQALRLDVLHRARLAEAGDVGFAVADELARTMLRDATASDFADRLQAVADDPARAPPERILALAGRGLALLRTGRPAAGRQALVEAGRRRLAGLHDLQTRSAAAAPALRWPDRLLLEFAVAASVEDGSSDADLILAAHIALNRGLETAPDDALLLHALQPDDQQRQHVRNLTSIGRQQQDWERSQAAALVARLTPGAAQDTRPDGAAEALRGAIFATGQTFVGWQQWIRGERTAGPRPRPPHDLTALAAVQRSLTPDEALVLHIQALGRLVKLCIGRDAAFVVAEAFDAPQAAADGRALAQALGATHPPSLEADRQYPVAEAMRLGKRLLGGLETCRQSRRRLYVVLGVAPIFDGPPAALLAGPPPAQGTGYDLRAAPWLVRSHAFVRVASVPAFMAAKSAAPTRSATLDYLGVGDPVLPAGGTLPELPEAAAELSAAAALFAPSRARLLVRAEATEDSVRRQPLSEFDVLHFATHGLVREEVPGLAEPSLVLSAVGAARDGDDDGLLAASRIAALPLRARLVVLSACNSARYAPTVFGEGLQGLAAAFALAGVPSAIGALWPVESGVTRDLVVALFDAARRDRAAVADALAQAMRQHLARPGPLQLAHPRFWAALVVLGEGGLVLGEDGPVVPRQLGPFTPPDGSSRGIVFGLAVDDGFVTLEDTPSASGSSSARLRRRSPEGEAQGLPGGEAIDDGLIAGAAGQLYVAGRSAAGTVVRALDPTGGVLWSHRLASADARASILALAGDADGAALVLHGRAAGHSNDAFVEVLRLDRDGRSGAPLARIPGLRRGGESGLIEAAGEHVVAVVNRPPRPAGEVPAGDRPSGEGRPAFTWLGQPLRCLEGDEAEVRLIAGPHRRQQARVLVARFAAVAALRLAEGWLVVGSERSPCAAQRRAAAFAIGDGGAVRRLWRDSTPFESFARGVRRVPGGIEIVGYDQRVAVVAPGRRKSEVGFSGEIFAVRLSPLGVELERDRLGAGWPLVPQGMVSSPQRSVVFGSIAGRALWLVR